MSYWNSQPPEAGQRRSRQMPGVAPAASSSLQHQQQFYQQQHYHENTTFPQHYHLQPPPPLPAPLPTNNLIWTHAVDSAQPMLLPPPPPHPPAREWPDWQQQQQQQQQSSAFATHSAGRGTWNTASAAPPPLPPPPPDSYPPLPQPWPPPPPPPLVPYPPQRIALPPPPPPPNREGPPRLLPAAPPPRVANGNNQDTDPPLKTRNSQRRKKTRTRKRDRTATTTGTAAAAATSSPILLPPEQQQQLHRTPTKQEVEELYSFDDPEPTASPVGDVTIRPATPQPTTTLSGFDSMEFSSDDDENEDNNNNNEPTLKRAATQEGKRARKGLLLQAKVRLLHARHDLMQQQLHARKQRAQEPEEEMAPAQEKDTKTRMRQALRRKLNRLREEMRARTPPPPTTIPPPVTALQEDDLWITDIAATGPEHMVRFVTAFDPPALNRKTKVSEKDEDKSEQNGDQRAKKMGLVRSNESADDQFADASCSDTEDSRKQVEHEPTCQDDNSAFSGQFDDPDDSSVDANNLDEEDNVPSRESPNQQPVAGEENNQDNGTPSTNNKFNHLKNLDVLKRKIELRRKKIELNERLQRLERQGGSGSPGRRYQGEQWTDPADELLGGHDERTRSVARSDIFEEEEDVNVDNMENLEDDGIPLADELRPVKKAKWNKEELEQRHLKAQQFMEITHVKHLVSKQELLLQQQQEKVTQNAKDIEQCRGDIAGLDSQLQQQEDALEDANLRKSAVDHLLQVKVHELMELRRQLHEHAESEDSLSSSV